MSKVNGFRDSLERGVFGRIFTSYGQIESVRRGGVICRLATRMHSSRAASRLRRVVSRSIEGSFILRGVRRASSALPWLTLRSYGMFFFSFGFYISIIHAIKVVATTLSSDVDALVCGIMMMVLSVPLLLSGKTLAAAVTASRAASYIAFDILGCRREAAERGDKPRGRAEIMFLLGMLTGLLSFYFDPHSIIAAILSLLFLGVVMAKPETGVILLFALFPFFSDAQLSLIVGLILLSYAAKLICGRRTLRIDTADMFMLVFFLLSVCASFISYGTGTGHTGSPRRIIYMAVYFLIPNLITNTAWRSRLVRTLMFGGSALAVISIAGLFADPVTSFVSGVGSRSITSFADWYTSSVRFSAISEYYLAMLLPVMAAYLMRSSTGGKRLNMTFFSVVTIVAAVLTMSRGLWLGALAGIVIMLILFDTRFVLLPAAAAVITPLSMLVLPTSVTNAVASMLDVTGYATGWRASVRRLSGEIFLDNFFGGIGSGDGVFYSVYDALSPVGASADNAQSLFLQIAVELGVFGLFSFLLATVFLLIKTFTGVRYGADRSRRMCSGAFAAGIIAALTSGISNYIWVDDRMLLLFFMFAGAASAYNGAAVSVSAEPEAAVVKGDAAEASIDIEY